MKNTNVTKNEYGITFSEQFNGNSEEWKKNKNNPHRYSFMLDDVIDVLQYNKANYNIRLMQYDSRNINAEMIKSVIDEYKDDVILTDAYCSSKLFPESEYYLDESDIEPNKKILPVKEELCRLTGILGEAGFENINFLVEYEYKEAMLYTGNDVGKKVMDMITSFCNES